MRQTTCDEGLYNIGGKMKSVIKGLISVGLSVFLFCFQQFSRAEGNVSKIVLNEVLSIGTLEDDSLFMWVGVFADKNNCIYVTDAMDYSLKKFDASGSLIKKVGRKGQGPGEFLAPRYLDGSEKYLYVTDHNIRAVQVFDKDLNFLRRFPLNYPVNDMKVMSDGWIAISSQDFSNQGAIYIMDEMGREQKKLDYNKKKSKMLMDVTTLEFDPKLNLYLAYNFQDRIEKFSADGKKLWSRRLLKGKKVKEEKINNSLLPTEILYKDLALDSAGRIFVLGGSLSINRSRDVYVLNPDGNLLTIFTLPEASHCIHLDQNDFLYSRANDGVTLKKYSLKYIYNNIQRP
jgi:hypothetical protein